MYVCFFVVMNLISAIERIPPSDLVSDELDLLLKRTQRGLVVLEQVGALTDGQVDGWAHTYTTQTPRHALTDVHTHTHTAHTDIHTGTSTYVNGSQLNEQNMQQEGYELVTFQPQRPSSAKGPSSAKKSLWLTKAFEVEMSRIHTIPVAYCRFWSFD